MLANWMLYCVTIGVLLAGGALALEKAIRPLRPATRWVWAAALLLTLTIPAVMRFVAVPRAVSRPAPVSTIAYVPTDDAGPSLARRPQSWWRGMLDARRLQAPLVVLWGVSSAAVVLALGVMGLALRRRRRAWSARTVDGVPVLVSADTGPAVVGLLRGRIVLPAWALDADDEARLLVLEHEQEHLRAGDPRLLAAGLAIAALMPWNPAVWWQLRRLRLAVEVDCDARVLARRRGVHAYGSVLLEIGRRASRTRLVPVAAFAEPLSTLERRIRIMTAPRVRRPLLRAAGFGALAAALAAVGCEAPAPTTPPPAGPSFAKSALTPQAAVAHYFPEVAARGTAKDDILLFVVSPEGDVVRHAWITDAPDPTVPARGVGDPRVTALTQPFHGKMQQVQLVEFRPGEVGPTATRVVWAQLRAAAGQDAESQALHEAIRRHYTLALRDAGLSGQVGVSFTVGADGKARDVEVFDDVDPRLAQAARAVIADLTFTPSKPGEEVVAVIPFLPERQPAPAAAR